MIKDKAHHTAKKELQSWSDHCDYTSDIEGETAGDVDGKMIGESARVERLAVESVNTSD